MISRLFLSLSIAEAQRKAYFLEIERVGVENCIRVEIGERKREAIAVKGDRYKCSAWQAKQSVFAAARKWW